MWLIQFALFFVSSLLLGCSEKNPQKAYENDVNQTGQLEVVIRMGKLAQETIARAEAVVSATDITTITKPLIIDGNTLSGFLGAIPAGSNRLFTLNAYDNSGNLIYTGSSLADVEPGTQTTLRITMRRVNEEIGDSPTLSFQGSGNGTTGLFNLDEGVYIATLSKNADVYVNAEFIDANTGNEVRFNFSSLFSISGFSQPILSKAFYVSNNGQYLINIGSTSGLKDWSIQLTESNITTIENGTPAQFSGNGNGTTGIVSLGAGAHVITITKDPSTYVNAILFDATTGEEIRFNFSNLMNIEGFGQDRISKGFVLPESGDYYINIEGNNEFDGWTLSLE